MSINILSLNNFTNKLLFVNYFYFLNMSLKRPEKSHQSMKCHFAGIPQHMGVIHHWVAE